MGTIANRNHWIDTIYCPQQPAGSDYVDLRTLAQGDTILRVCLDNEEFFGIYAGITVPEIIDGTSASVDVDLGEGNWLNIPVKVTNAGGGRYILVLSEAVGTFEVLGSLAKKVEDRKRTAGQECLIAKYAG